MPVRSRDELIAAIMGGHITGAHKVEGTNIYPLSKGIIKWSGIFGYWYGIKALPFGISAAEKSFPQLEG